LRKFEDGDLEPQHPTLSRDDASANPLVLNRRAFDRPSNEAVASNAFENTLADPQDSDEPTPDDFVEDFDPDDATAEVWTGEDDGAAEDIKNCLNGVGIGCVVQQDGTKSRLLVLPSMERRAREVIREIVDQTPSE